MNESLLVQDYLTTISFRDSQFNDWFKTANLSMNTLWKIRNHLENNENREKNSARRQIDATLLQHLKSDPDLAKAWLTYFELLQIKYKESL